MKRLLLPLLCALSSLVVAQSPGAENFSLLWAPGQVHFKSGDSLECSLRFNQSAGHHVLQVKEGGQIVTLPIRDVKSFSFFDREKNRKRFFSAFQKPELTAQEYYMEHIYADRHFSILNHKTLEVPEELDIIRFVAKPVKTHKKYICNAHTGKLLPLNRESLLQVVEPNRDKVLSFVKEHGIRFKRIADFIQVFQYYNTL